MKIYYACIINNGKISLFSKGVDYAIMEIFKKFFRLKIRESIPVILKEMKWTI
jgi:hypothetical protein